MEYKHLTRLVYLAAGLFMAIWFIHQVAEVILLLFFAIVVTIVLNAPVIWLQSKKMSRMSASLVVFFGMLLLFCGIGWMVIPKIITQVKLLIVNLPSYLGKLNQQFSSWIGENAGETGPAIPTTPVSDQLSTLINRLGQYSVNI